MSGWHREHPGLVGTEADPWMIHAGYRTALRETQMRERFPNLDAMIAAAEADSTHICEDCDQTQGQSPACRECGGPLTEREGP